MRIDPDMSGNVGGCDASIGVEASAAGYEPVIVRLDTVDSTNRYLADEARLGAPSGLVCLAKYQESGRGRRGRSFEAPAGSAVLCSWLFRGLVDIDSAFVMPSIVGLAAVDAIAAVTGVGAGLKWPNDIVVADAKVAGILSEVIISPRGGCDEISNNAPVAGTSHVSWPAFVVGLGINCKWPDGFVPKLTPGPLSQWSVAPTTLEAISGQVVDQEALFDALVQNVTRRCGALLASGGSPLAGPDNVDDVNLIDEIRHKSATIGRSVRLELPAGVVEGRAIDIASDGRLVVVTKDGTIRVEVADVVHLRAMPALDD